MSAPHPSWSHVLPASAFDAELAISLVDVVGEAAGLSALQNWPGSGSAGFVEGDWIAPSEHPANVAELPDHFDDAIFYRDYPERAKPAWLAEWEIRKAGRHFIRYAPGGDSCVFSVPTVAGRFGGDRRPCCEFSRRSKSAMEHFLASIDRSAVQCDHLWFVTLTYPGEWSRDPTAWKADLHAFRKRLERAWGRLGIVWKLEPQERGAPHFHLLVLVSPDMALQLREFQLWCSRAWFEVVDSGDERHLRAGTGVEVCRSWRGVASYCAKYLGKVCMFLAPAEEVQAELEVAGDELEFRAREVLLVGRFWGVWRRELWPERVVAAVCGEHELHVMRRALRKREEKRRGRMTSSERREFRSRWYGKLRSFRGFVPGVVVDRLFRWAFPLYGEGISYNEVFDFERELQRGRLLEREKLYHA